VLGRGALDALRVEHVGPLEGHERALDRGQDPQQPGVPAAAREVVVERVVGLDRRRRVTRRRAQVGVGGPQRVQRRGVERRRLAQRERLEDRHRRIELAQLVRVELRQAPFAAVRALHQAVARERGEAALSHVGVDVQALRHRSRARARGASEQAGEHAGIGELLRHTSIFSHADADRQDGTPTRVHAPAREPGA
jgi:hypothetical protein